MFQQQQQRPPPAAGQGFVGSTVGTSSSTQYRPPLMQQLPLAPRPKPRSLAHQMFGDNTSTTNTLSTSLPRHVNQSGFQPPSISSVGTQQRITPPPQVQQQYPQHPWAQTMPANGTQLPRAAQQQQQPWLGQQQQPGTGAGAAAVSKGPGGGLGAGLDAELGLPPLQMGPTAAAAGGTVGASAAGMAGGVPQQQQPQPVLGTDDVLRLQQEAEQLRNKVRKCYVLVCSTPVIQSCGSQGIGIARGLLSLQRLGCKEEPRTQALHGSHPGAVLGHGRCSCHTVLQVKLFESPNLLK